MTRIEVSGINKFADELAGKRHAVDRAARNIVTKGRLIVATKARKVFRPYPGGRKMAKSGNTYYVFVPPFSATPPKPTNRSGHLQESIAGGPVVRMGPTAWAGMVGTSETYARYVEFGTKFMAKEPFLKTGLRNSRGDLQELAEAEWEEAVR